MSAGIHEAMSANKAVRLNNLMIKVKRGARQAVPETLDWRSDNETVLVAKRKWKNCTNT